ncbi:MAG: T9SS type A sorting domain-containing protein [Bacteroidota bacterium]
MQFSPFFRISACVLLWVFCAKDITATTYFIGPAGNNANPGTSMLQAWQSIAAANAFAFVCGDSLLFEGGNSYAGTLYLNGIDCSAGAQITIGSYGVNWATIDAGSSYGIVIQNGGGFHISRLHVVGDGRNLNNEKGIFCIGSITGETYQNIDIDSVEVSGFNRGGISFGDNANQAAYENIRITNSEIHQNGDHGIEIERPFPATGYPHKNIYIARNEVHNNPGQIGKTTHHTGNGIMVGNADSVLIELNVAHHNGAENSWNTGGPVGIWVWDCNHANIQFNESHHNQTGSTKDGGGFDLDGGTINSVMQYNYSHDNDGAGFLVAEFNGARPMLNDTIRYNISENDGRKNSYPGIEIWLGSGVLDGILVHNNTVYVSPSPNGTPSAYRCISTGQQNISFYNNLFMVENGLKLLSKSFVNAGTIFRGNAYFTYGGPSEFTDGGTTYTDLAAWQAGTGQEMIAAVPQGFEGDPLLNNPGNGGTINNPNLLATLAAYQTQIGSPLTDIGLDLTALIGTDMGNQDFFNSSIPINGTPDISAFESLGNVLVISAQLEGESRPNGNWLSWSDPLRAVDLVEVQRRVEGEKAFKKVADLSAGTRSFLDQNLTNGKHAYRIRFRFENGEIGLTNTLSLLSNTVQGDLTVYPQPVGDEMTLLLKQAVAELRWEVLDLNGKIVLQGRGQASDGTYTLTGLDSLSSGQYFLRLRSPDLQRQARFIKQ